MVDYDWKGGHADLDNWWIGIWTNYVTQYGVDGFRLDTDIYRPDLWSRIRQKSATAGHPIVIFNEDTAVIPGVTDFTQGENLISVSPGTLDGRFADDIPGLFRQKYERAGAYKVAIDYGDGNHIEGSTDEDSALRVEPSGYTTNRVSRQSNLPIGPSEFKLTLSGIGASPIKKLAVTRLDAGGPTKPRHWVYGESDGAPLDIEQGERTMNVYLSSFYGYSSSVMLSCHDNGWTDPGFNGNPFPLDKSPYIAQGSRAIFGYSFLLTPMIPIFMAGEEFDADFHALPGLSPNLYGGTDPGQGRWLYGAQLNWSELDQPRHRATLEDVRKMLAIRRLERAVLAAVVQGDIEPRLTAVSYRTDIPVPVPYMRWSDGTAIIVAANRSKDTDAHLKLQLPLEKLGPTARTKFRVTDLWNDGEAKIYSAAQLADLSLTITRDNTRRGGLAILKVEAL